MKGSNDLPRSTQRGARSTKRSLLLMMLAAVTTLLAALPAFAGSDAEQFARFKDASQWGAPAGDLNQARYSSLHEINTTNVKNLQMSWAQSTGALRGHEGQPVVPTCRSATSSRRSTCPIRITRSRRGAT
jgi:glucose dehydrogenase